MSSFDGSITGYLQRLQTGDREVVEQLWQRYFLRLVGLARKRLGDRARRAADEEDVALSAFDSFCRAAEQGRFPSVHDRDDLWQVLMMITRRKTCDLIAYERRAKRDGRRTQPLPGPGDDSDAAGRLFVELVSREPDAALAAQVTEECERLLGKLESAELRSVAVWKMEGHTNEEIAGMLGCAVATVERRLRLIRKLWEQETAA